MENNIYKYFNNQLNKTEEAGLFREMEKDDSLKKEFIRLKNLRALSILYQENENIGEGKKAYKNFVKQVNRRKIYRIAVKSLSYAAAIIFLIVSTYLLTVNYISPVQKAEMMALHVPAGQRLQFTLQDGSTVWLNARSTLYYPSHFGDNERKVSISGEALFNVEKDSERPFIVSTQGVDMKVLGTTFNVYSYPDAEYIRTSLLEGSLKVYRENEEEAGIILSPNQQITIDNQGMLVDVIDDPSYFLWTEGIYSFHSEPLSNILKKLELYYDVKIIVQDASINNWEYTGKFRQRDSIDNILRIINKINSNKLKIVKNDENNTITLSKK